MSADCQPSLMSKCSFAQAMRSYSRASTENGGSRSSTGCSPSRQFLSWDSKAGKTRSSPTPNVCRRAKQVNIVDDLNGKWV